ncbi:MAG: hypothetical protein ACRDZ8_09420 [Acidimicrobiales bacterium]
MQDQPPTEFLAECFWPGVAESDLQALDERVQALAAELAGQSLDIEYLGSLLIRSDEVVFCRFRGREELVRHVAEGAGVPFERILEAQQSPFPKTT